MYAPVFSRSRVFREALCTPACDSLIVSPSSQLYESRGTAVHRIARSCCTPCSLVECAQKTFRGAVSFFVHRHSRTDYSSARTREIQPEKFSTNFAIGIMLSLGIYMLARNLFDTHTRVLSLTMAAVILTPPGSPALWSPRQQNTNIFHDESRAKILVPTVL